MTTTAVIVSRKNYQNIMQPRMAELKKKLFGNNENIYFHSREIRRKDGIYKIFLNKNLYKKFKLEMDVIIEKSRIKIITSSINKIKLQKKAEKFHKRTGNKYDFGDLYLQNVNYILERLGHFLKKKTAKIIFETRGKKESKRIQGVLAEAQRNGTFYHAKERFQSMNKRIAFFAKKDNINGLQMVDYCVYPFSRHTKNPKDKDNKFFDFLRQFVYKGNYGEYGLKEWP